MMNTRPISAGDRVRVVDLANRCGTVRNVFDDVLLVELDELRLRYATTSERVRLVSQ
jgi:hypothetical protein